MLSKRQIDILFSLYTNRDQLTKLTDLAKILQASIRTIQNDLKNAKEEWEDNGLHFYSIPSKGCGLKVTDAQKAEAYLRQIQEFSAQQNYFDDQQFRVTYLIKTLLEKETFIKSQTLADQMYLSKSRLSDDMKIVRKKLAAYGLAMISKPGYGLKVVGSEKEKRYCLIKENIVFDHDPGIFTDAYLEKINQIKDITTQILMDGHYQVSDIVLQNLIIHVYTSVLRMKENYFVEETGESLDQQYIHEKILAERIITECCRSFQLEFRMGEVDYLAINLAGKREYDNEAYISTAISHSIYEGLEHVQQLFQVDLTADLDLRIALGLHLIPLKSRIAANMQLKNITAYDVKQNFPFAFDVASVFIQHVLQNENAVITEDELSYIAIHFIASLEQFIANGSSKNLLIISSRKKSETILLQQRIKKWFSEVNEIAVKPAFTFSEEDLEQYNVILSTEAAIAEQYPAVRKINYFLTEEDYKKIESALSGLSGLKDILDRFSKDLFWTGKVANKEEIIEVLVRQSQAKYQLSDAFYQSILSHEQETSTYFGNQLSIIHPQIPMTDESFIAIGILSEKIPWITDKQADIVMLVSIEKDNPAALQLWYYLSYLIGEPEILKRIRENPTYENLIRVVNQVYKKLF